MTILKRPINELDLVSFLLVALLTILLLFDREFGLIYISMIIIWFVFYLKDKLFGNKVISFPVERDPNNRVMGILLAVGVYAGFLILSSFITKILAPGAMVDPTAMGVIDIMASDVPYFTGSILFLIIGWAVIIPIIETSVAGKLFEAMYDWVRSRNILNILIICLIIGSGFALLHLTSKGSDPAPLIVTFIFFTVTAGLIYFKKDLFAAIVFHIIANLAAVLVQLKVI